MFSFYLRSVLAAFVLTAVAVSASPSLSLKLKGPSSVTGVENLKITATITNTGTETLKILNDPRSLLSKRPANKFSITDGKGTRPSFTGIKVKYSPEYAAQQGAFTVLTPGASVSITHNLSEGYNFTISGAGDYDFEADSTFYVVNPNNEIGVVHATTQEAVITTKVVGNLAVARRDEINSHLSKRATFISCSSSRQSLLNTAIASAETYASNSYSYLNSLTTGSPRYTTWFGAYTSARRSTVLSHFNLINANDFSTFTYDCSCTDSAYAYVYPGTFGKIYLCSAFWNAPNTGTDSKAGTIIHEASHFTRNGGTDDYAYGHSAAKSLATSNPARAVMNADSHEYFAENTPALS
ncbi:Peptidyl-Lys metalloendopeptidase [Psilocybe cubensis]|uniref:Peptidyl-Lys metalloendopeptidase n=2 Tax=Psilocybe cubensis TaxID=181762 RepID=A0ACB8HEX0_PSICU|nr:Peptidyl-Lys metalloendopeptidase [Psilocybe cubensis]KAH9486376.1 Peptidyl-Lys metalloendopeptidase [Psilocybe cubensis]